MTIHCNKKYLIFSMSCVCKVKYSHLIPAQTGAGNGQLKRGSYLNSQGYFALPLSVCAKKCNHQSKYTTSI